MAVSINYEANLTAREDVSIPGLSSDFTALPFNAFNTAKNLGATTTPAVTKQAQLTLTLSSGAATLDLTAIATALGTVTFSGLKLQCLRLKAPEANTGPIVASKGASNGYGLTSAGGTFTIPIAPGAEILMYFDDEPPDVAGGAKTIDFAGTGSETLSVALAAG